MAKSVAINQSDLHERIEVLRASLTDPTSDPRPGAKALYALLVAPVEEAIRAAGLQSLMVRLDGRLRYIPFTALYDGEQWVAERLPTIFYTASSERPDGADPSQWTVAALGVSRAHEGFSPLPAVPAELDGIVKESTTDERGLFRGTVRLDEAFDEPALLEAVNGGYSILHIATHFDLRPGNDTDSHLLLGTGDRLSLRKIRELELDLRHLDMFTLSACNTAMGGEDAEGAEIEGMGTIVLRQGARGVIASLWSVADRSTGILMQTFYALRSRNPKLTKAEALRLAQLSLLRGEAFVSDGLWNRGLKLDRPVANGEQPLPESPYSHPYYWAPFILMGNWL